MATPSPVTRSARNSSFACCVLIVVVPRTKKKVRGIATGRVVASRAVVKHAQVFWNWTINQLPCKSVCQVSATFNVVDPIPQLDGATRPQPTRFSLVDLAPEPGRVPWLFFIAPKRAKFSRPSQDNVRLNLKLSLASLANDGDSVTSWTRHNGLLPSSFCLEQAGSIRARPARILPTKVF